MKPCTTDEEVRLWLSTNGMAGANAAVTVDSQSLEVGVDGDYTIEPAAGDLPVQFSNVTGSFYCIGAGLSTLLGTPRQVGRRFDCRANPLQSVRHAPLTIGGVFAIDGTPLPCMRLFMESDFRSLRAWRNEPFTRRVNRFLLAEPRPNRSNGALRKQWVLTLQQKLIEDGFDVHAEWE